MEVIINETKFHKILKSKGYSFEFTTISGKESTNVTNQDDVDLSNLTVLPENTTFSNQGHVNLSSLTVLPENTTFSNQGYVNLRSLTVLPENTTFSNQGYVNLRSLTVLPENTTFSNQGHVNLGSLTVLPENTTFSNQDDIDLSNLTVLPENTTFSNQGSVYLRSLKEWDATGCGEKSRNIKILKDDKGNLTVCLGRFRGGKEEAITAIRVKYGSNKIGLDYSQKIIKAFKKYEETE